MKKALKWTAIVVAVLVVLLIGAAVALPFVLPLDKIKDIATEKISTAINREVKVESVSFNIFSGIELKGLSVSNSPGFAKEPFVRADAIALRYAFWPLFKRQVIVKEVRLVKPEILIEKSRSGEFNFSDMTKSKGRSSREPVASSQEKDKGTDFSLIVDTFSIRNAKITYVDYSANSKIGIKDADLTVSGITLALLKPIGIDFSATADYKGQDVPVSLSTSVKLDLANQAIELPDLSLGVAGEKAAVSAKVSKLNAGPWVDFTISAKKFEIDPLLAIFTAGAATPPQEKEKLPRGALTKMINKVTASIPAKFRINGKIDIGNLKFLNFEVDKADLDLSLVNKVVATTIREVRFYDGSLSGNARVNLNAPGLSYNAELKLAGFNAHPFSNAIIEAFLTKLDNYKDLVDKVYGLLDLSVSLSGAGVEVPDIMANANAKGSLELKNGELKRLKTLEMVADKIKAPALKDDLKLSELTADFTFKDQVVNIQQLHLVSKELKVNFKGGIDLGWLKFVSGNRLTLKASPSATKGVGQEYELFRDQDGWLEATFELSGDLKKPIPAPVLEKPLERATEKVKMKIEAKTVEIKQEAEKKAEEEKQRLADEAKKKAEEEAKKQLQNIIKF